MAAEGLETAVLIEEVARLRLLQGVELPESGSEALPLATRPWQAQLGT